MSSTEPKDRASTELERFFFQDLVPLMGKLRKRNIQFFPIGVDPRVQSYYRERTRTRMRPEDFELTACNAFDQLEETLVAMWEAQGYPELAVLAPALSHLARQLQSIETECEEVSPFIYVMF